MVSQQESHEILKAIPKYPLRINARDTKKVTPKDPLRINARDLKIIIKID